MSLAGIDAINLADTVGRLSSRSTQRQENRPRGRGPVYNRTTQEPSGSVPGRLSSGEEGANALAEGHSGPVGCAAGAVSRRVRRDRLTVGVAIRVLVGGHRLPRGRLHGAAVARRRPAAVPTPKLTAHPSVLLAHALGLT